MTRPALANQPNIDIGASSVRPSSCEVIGRSGRVGLEPRVMEVLLALIEAHGAVLSREALVDACWDGRAVSEDAITRVISKIRRLSEGIAAGDFTIETLPKVGYRLLTTTDGRTEGREALVENLGTAGASSDAKRRGRVFASLAAVLVLGAAALGLEAWRGRIHASAAHAARAVSPAESAAADLETRGRAAVFEGTPAQLERGIGYLREATVRAPQDAHAWGSLAMAQVLTLKISAPNERPAIMLRVREAASKALTIDPHEGLALAAQVSLEPTFGAWLRKDGALARAEGLGPPDTPALLVQHAQFLAAIGRTREATAIMEHAAAVAPLLPWIQAARVQLLVDSQRLDEAERVADRAVSLWPRDPQVWLARYWLKIASGRPSDAVAMATNRSVWPEGAPAADMGLAADLARAVADRSVPGADAVLATYRRRLDRGGPDAAGPAIRAALALGRPQAALDFAERTFVEGSAADSAAPMIEPQRPGEPDTAALFSAPGGQLWGEPRFARLMQRTGLVGYWMARGRPDFCRDPVAVGACHRLDLRPSAG